MCVPVCVCVCVSLRLLSHLSLMFAQSREFLTSIIQRLSFSSDTLVTLSYPPFVAAIARPPWRELPSLGITGGDNAILLLANCDARKTALLSYEYSATVAGT